MSFHLLRCCLCVRALALCFVLAGPVVNVVAQEAPGVAPTSRTSPAPAAEQSPSATPATQQSSNPATAPGTAGPRSAADQTAPIGEATLPRDLSPWGMFMAADWIVKSVMIGLALASILCWTVWLAKSLELFSARRRARSALQVLTAAHTLAEARAGLRRQRGPAARFAHEAEAELRVSAAGLVSEGVKERIASRLSRIENAAGRSMMRGTGVLATIGSIGPFVGLFGTVWGIMNAFIGISKSQTTNLAVVAPGIAEALLATALGLVAAIPAVVIYNVFARAIAGYRALLGDAAAAVLRLVSRDLDRAEHDGIPLIRPRVAAE